MLQGHFISVLSRLMKLTGFRAS